MQMIYGVKDRPKVPRLLLFSLQQLLAILAATIAVPMIVGNGMQPSAALFGAGVGTIVYLLFTRFKSPVFLGSSFAFLGSMGAAFAGGVSMSLGYLGLLIGAVFAGLVYVIIAIIVKFAGTKWIDKIMPAVVIGPTVAIIGLSLAGNAIGDLMSGSAMHNIISGTTIEVVNGVEQIVPKIISVAYANQFIALLCGLVTLGVTIACSVYGKRMVKMIPFVIGILSGYALAAIFTGFSYLDGAEFLRVIDFTPFETLGSASAWYPDFAFVTAFKGGYPNTTYGESVGCVAISRNASVITILVTACMAILSAFLAPFTLFLASIPKCVMGGVCIALYGFIAVSGLKMVQKVDLNDNRNLFVVSVILIAGVGGMVVNIGKVTITEVACALILGILVNLLVNIRGKKAEGDDGAVETVEAENGLASGVEPIAQEGVIEAAQADAPAQADNADDAQNAEADAPVQPQATAQAEVQNTAKPKNKGKAK